MKFTSITNMVAENEMKLNTRDDDEMKLNTEDDDEMKLNIGGDDAEMKLNTGDDNGYPLATECKPSRGRRQHWPSD